MNDWKFAIILFVLPLMGCFGSKEVKPQPQAAQSVEDWEASLLASEPVQATALSLTGDNTGVERSSFEERVSLFRSRIIEGESARELIPLAEELWLTSPRTDMKTRLEIGFFLVEQYKKSGDIDRATQKNAEVLSLLEAMRGGKIFHEHQAEQGKIKNLSGRWGESEL